MKRFFASPTLCWRETTKTSKILKLIVLFLFFTGIYVAQNSLTKWKHSATASSSPSSFLPESTSNEAQIMFPNVLIEQAPISFNCDREHFELKTEINELLRIKHSVLNELRNLEEKRNVVRTEITILLIQAEKLQNELQQNVKDLEKIASSIEQAKTAYKEAVEKNMPEIYLPRKLDEYPKSLTESLFAASKNLTVFGNYFCTMSKCFDYSRCSFVAGFSVKTIGFKNFKHFFRSNAVSPCIVLINGTTNLNGEDDLNQILLENSSVDFKRKIVASSTFSVDKYRKNFDLVVPPLIGLDENDDQKFWINLPPIVPARRKFLLSFMGGGITPPSDDVETKFVIEILNLMQKTKTKDSFYVDVDCVSYSKIASEQIVGDWYLCLDETKRSEILKRSTFSLIVAPEHHVSTSASQIRLQEALKFGAIPVILGDLALPFEETLDWRKVAVVLPKARSSEMHFLLRTFSDGDVLELRRNGRMFYENYFRNSNKILDSLLSIVRYRLSMPADPSYIEQSPTYYNETFQPIVGDSTAIQLQQQGMLDGEEYLGPVELPFPSPKYQQNFSLITLHGYETWNVFANPFDLHEFNPFRVAMPSEAKFEGSQFGFRPINNGAGGSGKEFLESLGGNYPREQFTIVLLTYEREQVLLSSLARLNNLPYLNKIIIVWNGPTPPSIDSVWPKTSAPVVVVKPAKNSLNNRFYPFPEIETEAVLSIDDDVHLRHDEIIFGFRVWREARERIVGFPGRFHSWESSIHQWTYNSNHSCELSMVLTGASFVHKYYLHLYSNTMAKSVRDKVDELMNCEDIAINFLVSHVTRKPPIKVTSRWTFRCPGCPDTLSADDSHFNERHECINYFTRIYGYNPLLYTQFRVDSVLFKTKIPQNHQKCFKFI